VSRTGTSPSRDGSTHLERRRARESHLWGVNVAGYLEAELGIGEAARQLITALDAREVPVAPIGMRATMTRDKHRFAHRPAPSDGPFTVNVICDNAIGIPAFAESFGARFFEGRYSIGLWFWEVSTFPACWDAAFGHLDEVWAASEHIAAAVRTRSPIPVSTVRLPVEPVGVASAGRAALGLDEGFCFLFVFDYNSVLDRKNPLGLVRAFTRAFPAGSGASLMLKAINADKQPDASRQLRHAAAPHPDVRLLESFVSPEEKNALIASCDCYVSLHRSEGLGLTLAEAMYFERPVIATGYSGNLDFMTDDNGYLVDYRLRSIGPGNDPYPPEGEWAEPDVDHAARLMRQVFDHPEEARARGRRAARDIRLTHSADAAGRTLEGRLVELGPRIAGAGALRTRSFLDAEPAAPGLSVDEALRRRRMRDWAARLADVRRIERRLASSPAPEMAIPQRSAGRLTSTAVRKSG